MRHFIVGGAEAFVTSFRIKVCCGAGARTAGVKGFKRITVRCGLHITQAKVRLFFMNFIYASATR